MVSRRLDIIHMDVIGYVICNISSSSSPCSLFSSRFVLMMTMTWPRLISLTLPSWWCVVCFLCVRAFAFCLDFTSQSLTNTSSPSFSLCVCFVDTHNRFSPGSTISYSTSKPWIIYKHKSKRDCRLWSTIVVVCDHSYVSLSCCRRPQHCGGGPSEDTVDL